MDRLRYNHRQICTLLTGEKDFLLNLSENFGSLSPFQLRDEILKRIAEIDRAFVKTRKVKSACANGCHFVKNGTYKRGTIHVQNYICSVCGKPKRSDRVRSHFNEYLKLRLIQLKLEGIPMKWISKLLSISATKLDYQWRILSDKTFQQIIDTGVKTSAEAVAYEANNWDDVYGSFRKKLGHWEEPYTVEFPIDYDRVLTVKRLITESDVRKYRQVRLAQVILLMHFLDRKQNFGSDDQLYQEILKTRIKAFGRLAHHKKNDIWISKISNVRNQGTARIPFNIRFDLDHRGGADLDDVDPPRWKRVSVTF